MNKDIDKVMEMIADSGLRPGVNLVKEFKELLYDISKRDGVTPQEIIAGSNISGIIADQRISGPDRLKHIKQILLELRFPELAKADKRFKETFRLLKLNPKIKITPVPFYEDNKLKVEFNYRNPSELNDIIESLEKLAKVDVVKNALEDPEDIS